MHAFAQTNAAQSRPHCSPIMVQSVRSFFLSFFLHCISFQMCFFVVLFCIFSIGLWVCDCSFLSLVAQFHSLQLASTSFLHFVFLFHFPFHSFVRIDAFLEYANKIAAIYSNSKRHTTPKRTSHYCRKFIPKLNHSLISLTFIRFRWFSIAHTQSYAVASQSRLVLGRIFINKSHREGKETTANWLRRRRKWEWKKKESEELWRSARCCRCLVFMPWTRWGTNINYSLQNSKCVQFSGFHNQQKWKVFFRFSIQLPISVWWALLATRSLWMRVRWFRSIDLYRTSTEIEIIICNRFLALLFSLATVATKQSAFFSTFLFRGYSCRRCFNCICSYVRYLQASLHRSIAHSLSSLDASLQFLVESYEITLATR